MEAENAPARPPDRGVRRVARTILWPIRRFFDPRFEGVHAAAVDVRRLLLTDMEASNETATLTGRTLERLVAQNEQILRRLSATDGRAAVTSSMPAAVAYGFRALGTVPAGGSVAVVGSDDLWVAAALESLGYDVTTDHGLRTAHHEGAFDAVLLFAARDLEDRMRTLRELTKPGGLLVAAVDEPHRSGIETLLRDEEQTDVTEVDGITLITATKRSR